tara:strand:- start:67 stop:597 length:531 start_codon:yes stop_codon:yes gene_type:complete
MNNIPRLNIDELYETKQKSDLKKVNIFNKLLEKIHFKIKVASRQRKDNEFCYYVMPEVLIGYPNYNFEECLLYVISCLQSDGFLTKYIHPNVILISWRHIVPKYVRDEYKNKTGKIIDKFGNENKSASFERSTKFIEAPNRNTEKSSATTIPEKDYRPSGKFIYDKDVLKKIQEIL